jgi:hypothetical protein
LGLRFGLSGQKKGKTKQGFHKTGVHACSHVFVCSTRLLQLYRLEFRAVWRSGSDGKFRVCAAAGLCRLWRAATTPSLWGVWWPAIWAASSSHIHGRWVQLRAVELQQTCTVWAGSWADSSVVSPWDGPRSHQGLRGRRL